MAAKLQIDITADASAAVAGLDKASGAVKSYGDAAGSAAKQSRDISGGIESTGDTAAMATTGLRDLGGAMQSMGGTVGAMGTAMVTASTAFEALDGAATLYKAAQTAATAAAGKFNVIMNVMKVTILTNPIFLIAAIIIGIAVALVIAYRKSETFRRIVNTAFTAAKTVIMGVWNWIKKNWPLLLAILTGPIGLAILYVQRNWGKISTAINSVISWVSRNWGRITTLLTSPINAVISWVSSNWGRISSLLTAPFTTAWGVISDIFGRISAAVSSVKSALSSIHWPTPPSWLDAVIPGSFTAAPAVQGVARGAPAAPAAHAGGGGGIVVNVNGALDPEGVARQIRRILASSDRRGGRLGVLRAAGAV